MRYVGWRKNWDEWLARDSGRVRTSKMPSPRSPPAKGSAAWDGGESKLGADGDGDGEGKAAMVGEKRSAAASSSGAGGAPAEVNSTQLSATRLSST